MAELERISGMTFEEAKNILLTNVEQEIRHETAIMVKKWSSKLKDDAEKKQKKLSPLQSNVAQLTMWRRLPYP